MGRRHVDQWAGSGCFAEHMTLSAICSPGAQLNRGPHPATLRFVIGRWSEIIGLIDLCSDSAPAESGLCFLVGLDQFIPVMTWKMGFIPTPNHHSRHAHAFLFYLNYYLLFIIHIYTHTSVKKSFNVVKQVKRKKIIINYLNSHTNINTLLFE